MGGKLFEPASLAEDQEVLKLMGGLTGKPYWIGIEDLTSEGKYVSALTTIKNWFFLYLDCRQRLYSIVFQYLFGRENC